jgi:hypothetical protein
MYAPPAGYPPFVDIDFIPAMGQLVTRHRGRATVLHSWIARGFATGIGNPAA